MFRIPNEIKMFSNTLINFRLINYSIRSIPHYITQFKNLMNLRIMNVPLVSVPDAVGQLIQLSDILIRETNIEKLPKEVLRLPNVRITAINNLHLVVSEEDLAEVPETH